jgi:hypothetical protein
MTVKSGRKLAKKTNSNSNFNDKSGNSGTKKRKVQKNAQDQGEIEY